MGLRDGWSSSRNRLLTLASAAVAASIALGGASAAGARPQVVDALDTALSAAAPPSVTIETLSGPNRGAVQRLSPSDVSATGPRLEGGSRYRITIRAFGSRTIREVAVPRTAATTTSLPSVPTLYPHAGVPLYVGLGARELQLDPLWLILWRTYTVNTYPNASAASLRTRGSTRATDPSRIQLRASANGGPWKPFTNFGHDGDAMVFCHPAGGAFLLAFQFYDLDTGEQGPVTYRVAVSVPDPLEALTTPQFRCPWYAYPS